MELSTFTLYTSGHGKGCFTFFTSSSSSWCTMPKSMGGNGMSSHSFYLLFFTYHNLICLKVWKRFLYWLLYVYISAEISLWQSLHEAPDSRSVACGWYQFAFSPFRVTFVVHFLFLFSVLFKDKLFTFWCCMLL